jgi:DNA repair exonuclease SbcCD ATPase subunit
MSVQFLNFYPSLQINALPAQNFPSAPFKLGQTPEEHQTRCHERRDKLREALSELDISAALAAIQEAVNGLSNTNSWLAEERRASRTRPFNIHYYNVQDLERKVNGYSKQIEQLRNAFNTKLNILSASLNRFFEDCEDLYKPEEIAALKQKQAELESYITSPLDQFINTVTTAGHQVTEFLNFLEERVFTLPMLQQGSGAPRMPVRMPILVP